MYNAVKVIHDLNTTPKNLNMLRHMYDSKKNKALNRALAKVAPKNIVFSITMSLFDHLSLVIGIDSVGSMEYLQRLFQMVFSDEQYELVPVTKSWAICQDN